MTFERFEKKFLLTAAQYEGILPLMEERTKRDRYATYSIASIYYDTENFDLIRASLEKPVYKEKLRLRCYGIAGADTTVFLELKKKYKGRVYKRRVSLPYRETEGFPATDGWRQGDPQIVGEIAQFLRVHPVAPKVYIRYDRVAFAGVEDPGLRVTFDQGIRFRQDGLRLDEDEAGAALLPEGMVLMELKTPQAIPLWLCRALSSREIYPTSFSKYGTSYREFILRDTLQRRRALPGAAVPAAGAVSPAADEAAGAAFAAFSGAARVGAVSRAGRGNPWLYRGRDNEGRGGAQDVKGGIACSRG